MSMWRDECKADVSTRKFSPLYELNTAEFPLCSFFINLRFMFYPFRANANIRRRFLS